MTRRRSSCIRTWIPAACWLLATSAAAAAEPGLEDLKREVRALRAEVQALRMALSEAAELDRQRAALLTRGLEGAAPSVADRGAPSAERAPAPSAPAVAAAASVPSRPKRISAAAPELGMIRGKVSVPEGEPVAYVYVENIRGPATKGKATIEQSRKQFSPRWAVVQRGTSIEFPNLDNIYHNVFSRSTGNTFDLGLYSAADGSKSHTFYEPGAVDVYCNIHPQMSASVLVVPNAHFAKVKADGSFELANVPAGKRKLVAWAPGSNLASEWVTLESGATASVNLELTARSKGHSNKHGRPYGSYP